MVIICFSRSRGSFQYLKDKRVCVIFLLFKLPVRGLVHSWVPWVRPRFHDRLPLKEGGYGNGLRVLDVVPCFEKPLGTFTFPPTCLMAKKKKKKKPSA